MREAIQNPKGHLWYLPMVAQIYLLIPILKTISTRRDILKLFLGLWMLVCIIKPSLFQILSLKSTVATDLLLNTLALIYDSELLVYAGYVLLGYYVWYEWDEKISKMSGIILLYLFTVVVSCVINSLLHNYNGQYIGNFWNYNSVTAAIETFCIICFTKKCASIKLPAIMQKAVEKISSYTFGVYLIHAWFTEKSYLLWADKNIITSTIIYTVMVFLVSCVLVAGYEFLKNLCNEAMLKLKRSLTINT